MFDSKAIKVITLDLDDTLWAIDPVIRAAETAMYSWLAERCPRVTARYTPDQMRGHREQLTSQRTDLIHDLAATRILSLTTLLESCGYDVTDAMAAFEVLMEGRNRVECYDDVVPALEQLTSRYAIGAITNGNADLERIGLSHHFSFVVSAREVGAAKPAPEPFLKALTEAAVTGPEVLHVGDHPEHDIVGARAAGMRTAWINRHGRNWPQDPMPDLQVLDLLDLVRQLGEGG